MVRASTIARSPTQSPRAAFRNNLSPATPSPSEIDPNDLNGQGLARAPRSEKTGAAVQEEVSTADLCAALVGAGIPLGVRIPRACALTGLGRTTLYAAIRAGKLPLRKRGRVAVIFILDLVEFLRELPKTSSQRTKA